MEHNPAGEKSDHELVDMVKRGDLSAFDSLMLRHQEAVTRFLARFAETVEEVEDLTQTVFIKAYMGLSGYRSTHPFGHWLRTIAYHAGCDHWQRLRRHRHLPLFGDPESPAAVDGGGGSEAGDGRVLRAMRRLKPKERETLSLLYLEGLSLEEVARTMGWNKSATKMRAYRARQKLRRLLENP